MAPKKTLHDRMLANPVKGWTISDVEKLCHENDIELEPPSNGSHYKMVSPYLAWHQTVPYKRPIKAIYIKKAVIYVSAHRREIEQKTMQLEGKDKDNG